MPTDSSAKRRRRNGCLLTAAVVAVGTALGVYGVGTMVVPPGPPPMGRVASGDTTLTYSPEQVQHAATIAGIGRKRGLPLRAETIALATAMQESKLRNLDHGDRDSLGLFQQRPSQGWGTPDQLQDPVYATERYYDHLVKVRGYLDRPLTDVAQDVQRSGYPDAYAKHEPQAQLLAEAFTGAAPASVTCRLDAPTSAERPDDLVAALRTELGVTTRARGGQVGAVFEREDTAWAVGHWAVARAEAAGITAVSVGDRTWTRGKTGDASTWAAGGGLAPTQVSITLAP